MGNVKPLQSFLARAYRHFGHSREYWRREKYLTTLGASQTISYPCSFLIPSRNRPEILAGCLDNLLKVSSKDDEIVVALHMVGRAYDKVRDQFSQKGVKFLAIDKEVPLAFLWNKLIQESSYPDLFIMNDKARPDRKSILKSFLLASKGVGLCGLYRFGFFHFNKYLIYKIGWFDERLLDGGYEDCDFLRRMLEKDIAYYESEEIKYIQLPSSYLQNKSRIFFKKKWRGESEVIRGIAEQTLYPEFIKIYSKYKRDYLKFERSFVMYDSLVWFEKVIKEKTNK